MRLLARAARALIDLALSDGCAGCGTTLASREGPWCVQCALKVAQAAQTEYCPRCGVSATEPACMADGCPRCRMIRTPIDGVARIGEYDGLLQALIHTYKYGRQQRLAQPLAELLASALQRQAWLTELDAIVPVPTHWKSRWRYSFSPPTSLARSVGERLRIPVLGFLVEGHKKRRQADLSLADRPRNVRGKYRLRSGGRPAGGTFCVIDDVTTSGATLKEIARLLKRHGATAVYAAVIAKTQPDQAVHPKA